MMRLTALLLGLLAVLGCGSSPASNRTATLIEAPRVAFRFTSSAGSVLAMDVHGQVSIDGEGFGVLEADGRLSRDTETIAALIGDGRVVHRGAITDRVVSDGALTVAGERVAWVEGDYVVFADGQRLPAVGMTANSQPTVLYLLAVAHLETQRAIDVPEEEEAAAEPVERLRVPVDGAPSLGSPDAPVTIVAFSDFQCPFCGRVVSTLQELRTTYGDRLRIVFRHQPLPFHQRADEAAEAAMEAFAQQGDTGFWRMHDLLFENQRALEDADLESYATGLGLDITRFRAAMSSHAHAERVRRDAELGNRLGATGTPSFFINGRPLVGAQPHAAFAAIIDDELTAARRLVAGGVAPIEVYDRLTRGGRDRAVEAPARPTRPQPDPSAVYRVPVDGAPQVGRPDALVTLVVFSDFQCPFCSRVEPTIEQLRQDYGRELRVVWLNNPLPFHDHAMPAAEAAMEVFTQRGADAFWAFHAVLFQNQTALERADLERYASQVPGLSMPRFRRALDEHTHLAAIQADQDLARRLGASGTPSFFINGRNLRGAQPIESFRALIDEVLAQARQRVSGGTPRSRVYEAIIADGATAQVLLPGDAPEPSAPSAPREDPDRVYAISVPSSAPFRGAADAPVTLQLFSDFQCPFCARVNPTLDALLARYPGRVRLVWRDYPLPFHTNAMPAAIAAREVFQQRGNDAFWQFHALLFENQRDLSRPRLEELAQQIRGINMVQFRRALDTNEHQAAIQADMDAVQRAGAEIGTPSSFINGRLLQGAQPLDAFVAAIDAALAARP